LISSKFQVFSTLFAATLQQSIYPLAFTLHFYICFYAVNVNNNRKSHLM